MCNQSNIEPWGKAKNIYKYIYIYFVQDKFKQEPPTLSWLYEFIKKIRYLYIKKINKKNKKDNVRFFLIVFIYITKVYIMVIGIAPQNILPVIGHWLYESSCTA